MNLQELKLKPFCVECADLSSKEAQDLLNLAITCGAYFREAVKGAEYPYYFIESLPRYNHKLFKYVGLSKPFNTTIISDDLNIYNGNLLSYEAAIEYLEGLKEWQHTMTKQ